MPCGGHLDEFGIATRLGRVSMLVALVEDESHDFIALVARSAPLPLIQFARRA